MNSRKTLQKYTPVFQGTVANTACLYSQRRRKTFLVQETGQRIWHWYLKLHLLTLDRLQVLQSLLDQNVQLLFQMGRSSSRSVRSPLRSTGLWSLQSLQLGTYPSDLGLHFTLSLMVTEYNMKVANGCFLNRHLAHRSLWAAILLMDNLTASIIASTLSLRKSIMLQWPDFSIQLYVVCIVCNDIYV